MGLPPPYHPKDPNRIKRRKLREFTEEYYLPSHSDIEEVDYFGPECMCVKCAISNGQIISTPGVRCNVITVIIVKIVLVVNVKLNIGQ